MSKYLYHWGIKGMKRGQRRYQNEDGILTPAGRERYSHSGDDDNYGYPGHDSIQRGSDTVSSVMSSIGSNKASSSSSYDYESLLKANQALLDMSIEDIMKGLR